MKKLSYLNLKHTSLSLILCCSAITTSYAESPEPKSAPRPIIEEQDLSKNPGPKIHFIKKGDDTDNDDKAGPRFSLRDGKGNSIRTINLNTKKVEGKQGKGVKITYSPNFKSRPLKDMPEDRYKRALTFKISDETSSEEAQEFAESTCAKYGPSQRGKYFVGLFKPDSTTPFLKLDCKKVTRPTVAKGE